MITNDREPRASVAGAIGSTSGFWRDAFTLYGSATPYVLPHVLLTGAVAALIVVASALMERYAGIRLALAVAYHEVAGAVLGVLLVLRTNAGYDRWWEARRLWGGIVNQSRNLVITALENGPQDPGWQEALWRWAAAFAHASRRSLRGERDLPEIAALLGEREAGWLAGAAHMPSYAAQRLSALLRSGRRPGGLDGWAWAQADRERAQLVDHIGGCERILKTPIPVVYRIKIRRYIALFLLTLPFALLYKLPNPWAVPLLVMLAAYPLLAVDYIGQQLQDPFSVASLNHLPLDDICDTIQENLRALHRNRAQEGEPSDDAADLPRDEESAGRQAELAGVSP